MVVLFCVVLIFVPVIVFGWAKARPQEGQEGDRAERQRVIDVDVDCVIFFLQAVLSQELGRKCIYRCGWFPVKKRQAAGQATAKPRQVCSRETDVV